MKQIKRCILDTGWGIEPYTVKNHLLEVKVKFIKCKDIGKAPSYPSLVPHLVKALLVMDLVVDMLMRSLDPGRLSAFIQFDTFRISRSKISTV